MTPPSESAMKRAEAVLANGVFVQTTMGGLSVIVPTIEQIAAAIDAAVEEARASTIALIQSGVDYARKVGRTSLDLREIDGLIDRLKGLP